MAQHRDLYDEAIHLETLQAERLVESGMEAETFLSQSHEKLICNWIDELFVAAAVLRLIESREK